MILHQFYLNCLAHASYLIGDEASGVAAVDRSAARHRAVPVVRRAARAAHRPRHPHALARRLHRRASRAARPRRRDASISARRRRRSTPSRRSATAIGSRWGACGCRPSKRPATRRNRFRSRSTTSISSDAEPHAVLTGDTLFVGDVGRPDLRAALGWSAADLGSAAVRLAAHQAADAAGCQPGLPRARRRLAVRQGDQQGDGVDDRRAAPLELRAAADDQAGVRRSGDGGSAGRAGLLHLRRGAEQQGAADAGRSAGARGQPDDARSAARAARGRRADPRHARSGGVRRGASRRQPQHRTRRPVRDVGRHHSQPRSSDRHHRRPGPRA